MWITTALRSCRYWLAAGVLCACATPAPMTPEAMAPLTCLNPAQCALYWQRAQAWVAESSAYRVQLSTDTVIQTYGPLVGRADMAYVITKIPRADGSADINIRAECDNVFRCSPELPDALISFKRFVRG